MAKFPTYEGDFKTYEDGNHRRYELLFAVNGGAFVIAKLFAEKDVVRDRLGFLHPGLIAVAMIAYTIIMWWDTYTFGQRMHWQLDEISQSSQEPFYRRLFARSPSLEFETFGAVGKMVLVPCVVDSAADL
jgi:hypothetical protein